MTQKTMTQSSDSLIIAFKEYLEVVRSGNESANLRARAAYAILTGEDLSARDPASQIIRNTAAQLRRHAQAINRGMA